MPPNEISSSGKELPCTECGKVFDVEELTKIRGEFYCKDCKDIATKFAQSLPFVDKYNIRALKATILGCGVLIVVACIIPFIILIYSYFSIQTELRCRDRMMMLYKVLTIYAREHGMFFPPDNNDLRPLFGEKYTMKFGLFKCPGTENIVTEKSHLKDDSGSPTGTGMSYFFQGGCMKSYDKKTRIPLLWDQSPKNHKGKGINVLYTNGSARFITEDFPELKQQ